MARVAKSLGFTTMSLYRYVTSKDDLLLLMQEVVLDLEFPPPHDPADWRAELREWALFTFELFRRHSWVLDVPVTGAPITPASLRALDAGLRALRSTPLDDGDKIATILLLNGFTRNAALLDRDLQQANTAGTDAAAAVGPELADTLRALVDEVRFPYLRPIVERGTYAAYGTSTFDDAEDVGWGLERTLDGVAAYVAAREAAGGHDPETPPGSVPQEEGVAEALGVAQRYASDPKVKKAAGKRKEAEKRVREAQKRVRELEKALRDLRKAEAETVRAAQEKAERG